MVFLYPIYDKLKEEDIKKPFEIELDKTGKYILVGDKMSSEAAKKGLLSDLGKRFGKTEIEIDTIEPANLLKAIEDGGSGINLMFCFSVTPKDPLIPEIKEKHSQKIKQTNIVLIKKYKDKRADIRERIEQLKANTSLKTTSVLTYSNYINPLPYLSILATLGTYIKGKVKIAKSIK